MAEYIEREALMDKLRSRATPSITRLVTALEMLKEAVKNTPAADVAPVRHGRWVEYENEADKGFHYCSECNGQAFNYEEGNETIEVLTPWCPNCGAMMDGGNDNA